VVAWGWRPRSGGLGVAASNLSFAFYTLMQKLIKIRLKFIKCLRWFQTVVTWSGGLKTYLIIDQSGFKPLLMTSTPCSIKIDPKLVNLKLLGVV